MEDEIGLLFLALKLAKISTGSHTKGESEYEIYREFARILRREYIRKGENSNK